MVQIFPGWISLFYCGLSFEFAFLEKYHFANPMLLGGVPALSFPLFSPRHLNIFCLKYKHLLLYFFDGALSWMFKFNLACGRLLFNFERITTVEYKPLLLSRLMAVAIVLALIIIFNYFQPSKGEVRMGQKQWFARYFQ